jgi:multiple sugar transport system substrate-binding protein
MSKLVTPLLLGALLGISSIAVAHAQVRVGVEASVTSDALVEAAKEFTKATGIEVEISQFPYEGWVTQFRTEAAVRSNLFDVVKISAALVGEGVANQYIEAIENLDVSMLDLEDIPLYDLAKYTDGKHYMVPYYQEPNGLILRTDLLNDPVEQENFKKEFGYDLAIPKTEAQYEDQLKFFTRPDDGLYGLIMYGKRAAWIQIHFQNLLHARGLEYMDWTTFEPRMSTPEVQQALADWKNLYQYADPSSLDADWFTGNANFQAGRAYSIDTWGTAYVYANDETTSKVAGNLVMVPYPSELPRPIGFAVQDGLALTTTSTNRDDAWKFITWVSSAEAQKAAVLKSKLGTIPSSFAALSDEEVNAKISLTDIANLLKTEDIRPDSPLLPEGRQINLEILTKYLSMYLTGELTAEQMGEQFDSEINAILQRGGYDTPWLNN